MPGNLSVLPMMVCALVTIVLKAASRAGFSAEIAYRPKLINCVCSLVSASSSQPVCLCVCVCARVCVCEFMCVREGTAWVAAGLRGLMSTGGVSHLAFVSKRRHTAARQLGSCMTHVHIICCVTWCVTLFLFFCGDCASQALWHGSRECLASLACELCQWVAQYFAMTVSASLTLSLSVSFSLSLSLLPACARVFQWGAASAFASRQ